MEDALTYINHVSAYQGHRTPRQWPLAAATIQGVGECRIRGHFGRVGSSSDLAELQKVKVTAIFLPFFLSIFANLHWGQR
jgi:hypothetical protein